MSAAETILSLGEWLAECGLVLIVHGDTHPVVVVLYPPDDPVQQITVTGNDLHDAVAKARRRWDGDTKQGRMS